MDFRDERFREADITSAKQQGMITVEHDWMGPDYLKLTPSGAERLVELGLLQEGEIIHPATISWGAFLMSFFPKRWAVSLFPGYSGDKA